MAVFDRSWYGRVLVERVEGFATKEQWHRAYDEICGFEETLVAEGMILVKFWMHLSPEEQQKRFDRRQGDPLKQWKLTDEDFRNQEKRKKYVAAVEDMLERTEPQGRTVVRRARRGQALCPGRRRAPRVRHHRGDRLQGPRPLDA